MRRFLLVTTLLFASLGATLGQVPPFPQTLPSNTVVGRLGGTAPGPSQAVPFGAMATSAAFNASSWAIAGGTANAITATLSPPLSILNDGQLVSFRATGANSISAPTFSPNGLTPRPITKSGGQVLGGADIPGAGAEVVLRYNLANTRWELLNPASSGGGGGGSVSSVFSRTGAVVAANNDYDFPQIGPSKLALSQMTVIAANSLYGNIGAGAVGVPVTSCTGAGNALQWTAGSGFGCVTIAGGGGVTSVFGRTGVVVANTNDYTFAQISSSSPMTFSQLPSTNADSLIGNPTAGATTPTNMGLVNCAGGATALNYSTSTHLFTCNSITAGAATSVTVGSTTIGAGHSGYIEFNNAGVFGEIPTFNGDATLNTGTGLVTVTKTNGVAFATSATTDTTNANNITSGSLGNGRLTTGFVVAGTGLTGGSLAGGGTVAADLATAAQFEAGTANKLLAADKVFTAEVAVTFSTTPTFDFSTFINASITLTANISSITFSNMKAGQAGIIRFIQDGTGSRTIPTAVNSNLKCAGGCSYVLSTTASAVDAIPYQCISTTYCIGGALLKALQ